MSDLETLRQANEELRQSVFALRLELTALLNQQTKLSRDLEEAWIEVGKLKRPADGTSLSPTIAPSPPPIPPRILRNRARCLKCGDTVESTFRHDFVYCKCGAVFVDGGKDYLRRGGELRDIEELSEFAEEPTK